MNQKEPWWQSFFSGLSLEVQRIVSTEEDTIKDTECIQNALRLKPPCRILDVPCGNGRISLELAKRGYELTGVDLSSSLIGDGKAKAAERGLQVVWEQRDMRDLPWKEEYDAAFCFGGSFGYFDDNCNLDFLRAVVQTLRPAARFMIDAHVTETILPKYQERDWHKIDDMLMLQERRYVHVHSRIDAEYKVIRDGKIESFTSSMRIYSYFELFRLLKQVGFSKFEAYGSLSLEPFQFKSPRLYLVAMKQS